ncbi:hypothetical protein GTP45_05775 [Pseudoduganella sp. FT55W]|uniref:Uncharacterized protein n=1 Tax=Duganella rivi TaxID=2666083 RepID=A0A7X4GPN4_9BURK|nr:hypothetical protein [Duganella rivi]MYM66344.1 hypothetical protein [Duganella rivi]
MAPTPTDDEKQPPASAASALPAKALSVLQNPTTARLAISATGLITLIIAFANTQLQGMMDQFTSGCQAVIEQETQAGNQVRVTTRTVGKMPDVLHLTFARLGDAKIKSILLASPMQYPVGDSLTAPPRAGETCPGQLCESAEDGQGHESLKIVVERPQPEFVYRYLVTMQPDPKRSNADQLLVYAPFPRGFAGVACKVQPKSWYNLWIWGSPMHKSIFFGLVIIVGGLLLGALAKKGNPP